MVLTLYAGLVRYQYYLFIVYASCNKHYLSMEVVGCSINIISAGGDILLCSMTWQVI